MTTNNTQLAIDKLVREQWGQILASLISHTQDFELAEDVLQDAVLIALQRWPQDGVPHNPRAWLLQTARRKAIDRFRRQTNFDSKRSELEFLAQLGMKTEEDEVDESIADERLRLIFTCCHPALAEPTRIALTLKTLGGLSTSEIARAFLVPEITMAQRIVRAKRKIKTANIPYKIPPKNMWPERVASVLSVIYLIFNEGYAASSGDNIMRAELCGEAIRLGQILVNLTADEPEASGLLALMLLHDSRSNARTDSNGNFVTLALQNRDKWDYSQITTGTQILRKALAKGRVGPYQIQAAISAVHAEAKNYASTNWREIILLYNKLYEIAPSPVVELNAIVAYSMVHGPQRGLIKLKNLQLRNVLNNYQPFHATLADLLRRAGQNEEAAIAYRSAIKLSCNDSETRFLEQRLLEVSV